MLERNFGAQDKVAAVKATTEIQIVGETILEIGNRILFKCWVLMVE